MIIPSWFGVKVCYVFGDQYICCRIDIIKSKQDYPWFQPPWMWSSCGRRLDTIIVRWKFDPCVLKMTWSVTCTTHIRKASSAALSSFLTKPTPLSIKSFCTSIPISRIISTVWRILSIFPWLCPWHNCFNNTLRVV